MITFRTTSVYSIPSKLSVVELIDVTRTYITGWMSLNFGQIPSLITELAALEHLKTILPAGFLFKVTRTYLKVRMSMNFGQIPLLTRELAALEHLKLNTHQIGFALRQSGVSKKESAGTPFVVNAMNLALCTVAYWATGYTISRSEGLFISGYNDWFVHEGDSSVSMDWFTYFSLALIVVNIASTGGVARCPLWITAVTTVVLSGIIFPLSVRWGWHHSGWMLMYTLGKGIQYHDVGGSGPIHTVGGAAALVINIICRPSKENRQREARVIVNDITGHSVPFEILGSYMIIICVLSTNILRGLSTYLGSDPTAEISRALMNSVISSSICWILTIILSTLLKKFMGQWRFHWMLSRMSMNAILFGTVAVSAGCTVYDQWACALIGVLSSIGYIIWTVLMTLCNIDDATGSITVHLGGGLLGCVCAPIFKQTTGLVFTEFKELAAKGVLWNFACVMAMIGLTIIILGLTLVIPAMMKVVPISVIQQSQGVDWNFIGQEAYPNSHTINRFNTDAIEDRETFSDSHQTTPISQQTFPNTFGFDNFGVYPEVDGQTCISGMQEISPSSMAYNAYGTIPDVYRDLPVRADIAYNDGSRNAFSPYALSNRHVSFGEEMLQPEQAFMHLDERYADNNQFQGRRLEFC